jgi:3-oxoacyl-[acyl-carrier protein] reductase
MRSECIVITGSSKGIGNYLAHYYLNKGWQVTGVSRTKDSTSHPNFKHLTCNISSETEVRDCIAAIRKAYSRIDVLINNAAIASMNHTLLTPETTVDKVFNTNFKGTFLFSREVARLMQKEKYGRIINFTTVAVPLNLEGEAIYAASKSAVETLTRIMAKELGNYGITVNAIGPCPVETNLIRTIPKEKIDKLIYQQAIKRLGKFEDIANVIDFYMRPESDFITGQTIYLGGIN